MRQTTGWAIGVVAIGLAAAAFHFSTLWLPPPATPLPTELPAATPARPSPAPTPTAPVVRYPLANTPAPAEQAEPLPVLDQSDAAMQEALRALVGAPAWTNYFRSDMVIRRIVATIDNLPRAQAAARMMPQKPVGDTFRTVKADNGTSVDAANAARYAPYVKLMSQVDAPTLVATYVRFYPLFQRAYEDLGYPSGYFNDRVITAIDDMLAAPAPAAPIQLTQPRVLYEYADPDLEALSAGQKIMLRIGRDNESQAKAKLRAIRQEIMRHTREVSSAANRSQ